MCPQRSIAHDRAHTSARVARPTPPNTARRPPASSVPLTREGVKWGLPSPPAAASDALRSTRVPRCPLARFLSRRCRSCSRPSPSPARAASRTPRRSTPSPATSQQHLRCSRPLERRNAGGAQSGPCRSVPSARAGPLGVWHQRCTRPAGKRPSRREAGSNDGSLSLCGVHTSEGSAWRLAPRVFKPFYVKTWHCGGFCCVP